MPTTTRPTFSKLPREDVMALLERNRIGRLAFAFHDRVDIEPISYVFADGWRYARTSPGTKLDVVHHHPWVAFQVDEIHSRVEWQSVVVRGTIYFLTPDGSDLDREAFDAAVEILRSEDADALTDADLTPHRQDLFRIHADEITGRQATPGP